MKDAQRDALKDVTVLSTQVVATLINQRRRDLLDEFFDKIGDAAFRRYVKPLAELLQSRRRGVGRATQKCR